MIFTSKVTGENVKLITINSKHVIYRELVWFQGGLEYKSNVLHYADVTLFLEEFNHNKHAEVK